MTAATTARHALQLSTGSFDQDTTFVIAHAGRRGTRRITAALYRDYQTRGDGIYWAMQIAGCLKSSYTDKDRAESARLNAAEPVVHGDVVEIEGKLYTTRVLGDFSDCAVFDPVA